MGIKKKTKQPESTASATGSNTPEDGGAGGNGATPAKTFKVSKIGISPSRKVNLGNYSSVELSAFIEMTFDEPVDADSKEVTEAFATARRIAKDEFLKQFAPYKKQLEQK